MHGQTFSHQPMIYVLNCRKCSGDVILFISSTLESMESGTKSPSQTSECHVPAVNNTDKSKDKNCISLVQAWYCRFKTFTRAQLWVLMWTHWTYLRSDNMNASCHTGAPSSCPWCPAASLSQTHTPHPTHTDNRPVVLGKNNNAYLLICI